MAISYASLCPPRAQIDQALSSAISAILAHDPTRALALLDSDTMPSPWVKYNRGVALADLHRTDDAARAFDAARDEFAAPQSVPGRERASIAVYGKARAYNDALRCADAWTAYQEYARLVGSTHPSDAELALTHARECVKRWEPSK